MKSSTQKPQIKISWTLIYCRATSLASLLFFLSFLFLFSFLFFPLLFPLFLLLCHKHAPKEVALDYELLLVLCLYSIASYPACMVLSASIASQPSKVLLCIP
jgi:hypothetical protein